LTIKEYSVNFRFPFWGPLLIETNVDREFVDLLLEKGQQAKLDARKYLAGKLDKEFFYEDYEDWFLPRISPYVTMYFENLVQHSPISMTEKFMEMDKDSNYWYLDTPWINYQRANEYNPPHNHAGHLSFVIYLQVPEELFKEYEETKDSSNSGGAGVINFQYGESLPFNAVGYQQMPQEGMILIFPSWLTHHVFAFKSDVERISVSGNVNINPDLIRQV